MVDSLFQIVGVVFFLLFVIAFALEAVFRSTLRERHFEVWKSLGSPTLFLNNSIANSLRVERFLWRSEYKNLGDQGLNRLAIAVKAVGIGFLVAFVAFVALQIGGAPPK